MLHYSRPCYPSQCLLYHGYRALTMAPLTMAFTYQVLNSLLYWLLDMVYKEMARGEQIPKWAPEPFLLRRPVRHRGVEP